MCKRIITDKERSMEAKKYTKKIGGLYNPLRLYDSSDVDFFYAVIIADDNLFEGL